MKIEIAKVTGNELIAKDIWRMEIFSPQIAQEVKGPGQFINILVDSSWEIPLRCPMSLAGVEDSRLSIIYKIFGEGSRKLSFKQKDDKINLLGPLGNTFDYNNSFTGPVFLVGGGVGIAPILWLYEVLTTKRVKHLVIMGAKTSAEHFLSHQPEKGIFIATDDGSSGEKGTVVTVLENLVGEQIPSYIYACGPEPMLKAVRSFSLERNVPCQMALESYMGCGIGICQSCVVQRNHVHHKLHSYHEKYSLVCCDGPVYEASEVIL